MYNSSMSFKITTHLQDILEDSQKNPVIIFKYSNSCKSSEDLKKNFEKIFSKNKLQNQVYLITVQIQINLSNKIEEYFNIKHESPQIIVLEDKKVVFFRNHKSITVQDLLKYSL